MLHLKRFSSCDYLCELGIWLAIFTKSMVASNFLFLVYMVGTTGCRSFRRHTKGTYLGTLARVRSI